MTAAKSNARAITGTRTKAERGNELHETPAFAVRLLMEQWPDFFGTPRTILEPHCGPGQMVAALQTAGHNILAADLVNYEDRWKPTEPTVRVWGQDFLAWPKMEFTKFDAIVMNPPYSQADDHVSQALTIAPLVFALLELPYLNGVSEKRCALVDDGPLIAAHPFTHRLPMHADNFTGKRNKNTRRHGWFVFEQPGLRPARATIMRRIGLATREERAAEGVWS